MFNNIDVIFLIDYQVCADNTSLPTVRSLACSVICLMSVHDDVRMEVAESGAIPSTTS